MTKADKNPTGGLSEKGRRKYNRATGGNLQRPVTGKVKPGSKAAKRRKSFCARMSGVKGPMKDSKGRPTRKALALRKWKCSQEIIMPKVGGKKFKYTKKGMAAAKKEAKKSGKKVKMMKGY